MQNLCCPVSVYFYEPLCKPHSTCSQKTTIAPNLRPFIHLIPHLQPASSSFCHTSCQQSYNSYFQKHILVSISTLISRRRVCALPVKKLFPNQGHKQAGVLSNAEKKWWFTLADRCHPVSAPIWACLCSDCALCPGQNNALCCVWPEHIRCRWVCSSFTCTHSWGSGNHASGHSAISQLPIEVRVGNRNATRASACTQHIGAM